MSIAEKFEVIADKVYEKGINDGIGSMWDTITQGWKRFRYSYVFREWGVSYIRPPKKIIAKEIDRMFASNSYVVAIEKEYFDVSQATDASAFANSSRALKVIEDIGFNAITNYNQAFANSKSIETIAKLDSLETTTYYQTFHNSIKLKNITFSGVIGKDIDFGYSPLLTDASLENIAQHLKDFSPEWKEGDGNKAIITLHATVKERIKNTEIDNLIKSKKWGIA